MKEAIEQLFNAIANPYVSGILISMMPIVELRGGIPYIYFRLGAGGFADLSKAFLCAFVGSSLVIPLLLLLLIPVLGWLKKRKIFKKPALWIENHFNKKSQKLEEKSENESSEEDEANRAKKRERVKYLGLYIFTAIPLPLTGVWSASAVAAFLKMDFKKSCFFIMLGNLTAGLIISALSLALGRFI